MKPFITDVFETDAVEAFAALHHLPYSIFFDSADRAHKTARYSFIAALPLEIIEAKNGRVTITRNGKQTVQTGDPFAVLKERLAYYKLSKNIAPSLEGGGMGEGVESQSSKNTKHPPPESSPLKGGGNRKEILLEERGNATDLPPFTGGAAGVFGYDLGRGLERLPELAADSPDMPDMAIGIYDQVLAFDHEKETAQLISRAADEHEAEIRRRPLLRALSQPPPEKPFEPLDPDWQPDFDVFSYSAAVQKIIDYIRAGDIFQANFAQRFEAALPRKFCPFAHYRQLRRINPAPFAGFMNAGAVKIASASPERFLTVNTSGAVETRPIKGTRPRTGDPVMDKAMRAELKSSEKDRAENVMIVDLLRNDLSKVCTTGSIQVEALCALESFASVHHLVSTVTGQLKEGLGPLDLLQACFPGGSITGAPKIRAMEIIEELEPRRRGPYCGAMGYIDFDGTMDSNILIRTLVYEPGKVSFQAGGGITAESCPDKEYQESFDKADALFRSFEQQPAREEEHLITASAE